MVWDELACGVREKQPTSAQHLRELFQDAWKTIPGDDLMKLTERMPRACKAGIKAKGRCFEKKIENIQHIVVCLTLILGLFCQTFDNNDAENDRNKEVLSGCHKFFSFNCTTERIDVLK